MPTTDERRQVAARLRENEYGLEHFTLMEILGFDKDAEPYFDGYRRRPEHLAEDMRMRLADLIEPEPENTCHMEFRKRGAIYDVFYFDCCDEEYAESRTDQYVSGISGRVCPYCGAKVVE